MTILNFSTIITSLLMSVLLILVFFEPEFRYRNMAVLHTNTFKVLAGAAIFCAVVTCLIGLSIG